MSPDELEFNPHVVIEARDRVANRFGASFAQKASPAVCLRFGSSAQLESKRIEKLVLEMEAIPVQRIVPPFGRSEDRVSRNKELRHEATERLRSAFTAQSKSVQYELQRLGREFQTCWLNQTIQAFTGLDALTEVAEDPSLKVIDLPRELRVDGIAPGLTLFFPPPTEMNYLGKGVTVALIDGEADAKHPGLRERVLAKTDYTTEDWGLSDWHATAVAGILCGHMDGILGGFLGSAPECFVYNYKVFPTRGPNPGDFAAWKAIEAAVEDGADVANCSWGDAVGHGPPRAVWACDQAWDLGLTIVKSSGNKKVLTTPAEARGVIAVGACDLDFDHVPPYSGRGQIHDYDHRPHLVAPGGTSTVPMYSFRPSHEGLYLGAVGSGTSFAAACVTGTTARLLEAHPEFGPEEARAALIGLCRPVAGASEIAQGAGCLHPRVVIR
jgi:serine protease AprX